MGSGPIKHALSLACSVADEIGSYGLYLNADPAALAFYQKFGFVLLQSDQSPEPWPMFIPLEAIG